MFRTALVILLLFGLTSCNNSALQGPIPLTDSTQLKPLEGERVVVSGVVVARRKMGTDIETSAGPLVLSNFDVSSSLLQAAPVSVSGVLRWQPPFDVPEPEPDTEIVASLAPGHYEGWWELLEVVMEDN